MVKASDYGLRRIHAAFGDHGSELRTDHDGCLYVSIPTGADAEAVEVEQALGRYYIALRAWDRTHGLASEVEIREAFVYGDEELASVERWAVAEDEAAVIQTVRATLDDIRAAQDAAEAEIDAMYASGPTDG